MRHPPSDWKKRQARGWLEAVGMEPLAYGLAALRGTSSGSPSWRKVHEAPRKQPCGDWKKRQALELMGAE